MKNMRDMQKFSKKKLEGFSRSDKNILDGYIMGKHTRTAQKMYYRSGEWEKVPADDQYYLAIVYPVGEADRLEVVKRQGQAQHYASIAQNLQIGKGHLYNLAEKCGCQKIDDVICSESRENIETLIEALLPWSMAFKMRCMSQ